MTGGISINTTKLTNPNFCIGVLIVSALVSTFNETLLNVALIPIAKEMQVSPAAAQWLVTGYMLVASIMVPVTAFLYLSVKTRVLHLTALAIVLIGSLGCVFATSFPFLLLCRLLQAAGTGMMIPIMMNVIMQIAPVQKLTIYLSLGCAAIAVGPALGPTISGFIVQIFSWRASFLLIALFIAGLIGASAAVMKNVAELTHPHLDILSVILSTCGLAIFLLGISLTPADVKTGIILLIAGTVIIVAFAVRQQHLKEPMLNLAPFRNILFDLAMLLAFISMMINFSMNALMPSYLQETFGVTSMMSALILLPGVLLNAGSTLLGGRIMAKHGIKKMLPIGFLVFTLGLLLLSLCKTSAPLLAIVLIYVLLYQGLAFTQAPSQTTALESLPKPLYPHGVSLSNTFMQVAAAVGSSLFGGISSSVQADEILAGITGPVAMADGFGTALHVAILIGVIGFVLTFILNRKIQQAKAKNKADVHPQLITNDE